MGWNGVRAEYVVKSIGYEGDRVGVEADFYAYITINQPRRPVRGLTRDFCCKEDKADTNDGPESRLARYLEVKVAHAVARNRTSNASVHAR